MSGFRPQRVAEQMKKEIAELVRTDLKDDRLGFLTITRVEVSNDLQHAKVYASVFGNADKKQETLEVLQKSAGFIRGEVSRRLRMRLTPELAFVLDESGEYSAHIESVLRDLHKSSGSARRETEDS